MNESIEAYAEQETARAQEDAAAQGAATVLHLLTSILRRKGSILFLGLGFAVLGGLIAAKMPSRFIATVQMLPRKAAAWVRLRCCSIRVPGVNTACWAA